MPLITIGTPDTQAALKAAGDYFAGGFTAQRKLSVSGIVRAIVPAHVQE